MNWFHLSDGLHFGRTDDGGVRIVKTNGPSPDDREAIITLDFTTDADGWASTISSVCAHGETGETFEHAHKFHTGTL